MLSEGNGISFECYFLKYTSSHFPVLRDIYNPSPM